MKEAAGLNAKLRAELDEYGISLDVIRAETKEPRLFLCVIRGVLVFMAAFGTICGIASSFELEFDFVRVMILMFVISMFICLIYFNKVTFYTGYLLLLLAFALFSVRYFWYINSGFQAFLNVAAKRYGSYFNLPAVREASEIIGNRYETITMVMIFLGVLFALLLNISISAYMSLFLTFLVTFLPLQIAFYINRNIPVPYLMMILAVYISVMVLRRSGNFSLPSKYGKEHIFAKKTSGILKKNMKTVHKYMVNGTGMIWVAAASIVTAMAFMLVMNGMLKKTANTDEVTNAVKLKTDEYVKTIAQGGLAALFNRYDAVGGLSRGQLGGVGSVNPDFQTDLIVRFVPYTYGSIYLRSYVGKSYANNRFWPGFTPGERSERSRILNSRGESVYEEGWCDDNYLPVLAQKQLTGEQTRVGKIWIGNVGADAGGEYLPYYTIGSTAAKAQHRSSSNYDEWGLIPSEYSEYIYGSVYNTFFHTSFLHAAQNRFDDSNKIRSYGPENAIETYEGLFIPYTRDTFYRSNPTITRDYESYVYDRYLDVPDELRDTLNEIAREAGIDVIAEEADRAKAQYGDRFDFYSAIMSDDNGLSYAAKENAFNILRSNIVNITALSSALQADILIRNWELEDEIRNIPEISNIIIWTEGDILKEYDRMVSDLRDKAEKTLETITYDAGAGDWRDAYLFMADLFDKNRDMLLSEGYRHAAADINEGDYSKMQILRLRVLSTLQDFYRNEFSYTMSPGRTPSGRDTVEYFLTTRRRGFCAHFASSACLLLRSVGIPTRYVEGYVVSPEDINQGTAVDADVSEWKWGDYGYEDSAVVEVEISDASAHAWIEVYIDGHGWIPYEMTPPSEEEEFGSGLFGFLSGIINARQRRQSSPDNSADRGNDTDRGSDGTSRDKSNVMDGISFLLIPLLWLAGIFAAVTAAIIIGNKVAAAVRLKKTERSGQYSQALLIRYRTLVNRLKKKKIIRTQFPTLEDFYMETVEKRLTDDDSGTKMSKAALCTEWQEFADIVNAAAFSEAGIDKIQYDRALATAAEIKKAF